MNSKKITVIILVILFTGIAFYSMRGMFTPYVSFNDARKYGEFVQIIGVRDKKVKPEHFEGYFTFTMKDKDGTDIKVLYTGQKPLNFEHADQVVALGSYDREKKVFNAEKILIKCPSKYTKVKEQ